MRKNMKKQIKNVILISILLILVLPMFTTLTYATEVKSELKLIEKSESFLRWEQLDEQARKNTIQPSYFNIGIKDSIKRSTYNKYLQAGENLEETYSLKNNLSNIYVKNQQATGACWAFSYSSAIETTIANKYNKAVLEYSPIHIDYMTATRFNRKVGDGGTIGMLMSYGASGLGPVYESDLPFESVYDKEKNSSSKYYLSDIEDVELNQEQRARIEDTKIFATISKKYSTNSITYESGSGDTYTEEEVKVLRQLIKTHIKQNGGVTALFYSDLGTTADNQIISQNGYYNSEKYAYYCNDASKDANHGVTIVGWDDTFSKDNFAEGKKPLNDGAYIVLNSWGSEFGNNGYFYVSYDDAIIEQAILGISEVKEKENDAEKFYDNIYEYDELGMNNALSWGEPTSYAANVFNRKNTDQTEYLSEIGIYLGNTQGVEVYINPDDDNLNKGTLVASYTGANALETGYHTLKLSSPIELTGNKFVVKVKYVNAESANIPMEIDLKESGMSFTSTAYDTATSKQGESFISLDGNDWYDLYNLKVGYTQTLKDSNVCIKAFTTLSEGETTVAVTGVTLNKETVTIKEGQTTSLVATVLPENATNKNITWTSSNTNVATVSNGVITGVAEGTATITVTTVDGNFTDTCTVTVEKEQIVPENVAVTGVTLDKETVTIKEGQTTSLVATVLPENATNKNITWTSSNTNVATVSNGVITGEEEGTATITVKTVDGNFTDTCTVTVEKVVQETVAVTGIELNKDSLNMQVGERTNLVATIKPTNATNKDVIWSSSNQEVATISENGIIEALKEGKTTINVMTKDGSYKASCEVTVTKKTNTEDDIYTNEQYQPEKNDSTTAQKELPKAGINTIITIIGISVIVSIVIFKKYKGYKDIK